MATIDSFFNIAKELDNNFDFNTKQSNITIAQEQLVNNKYQAHIKEDINFKERTERIIKTSKSALIPRTLKAYTSLIPIFL
jgi:hypothetical protein